MVQVAIWFFIFYFSECLSSGYSCSIWSYTRTPTLHTHTTTRYCVQTDLQLHTDQRSCPSWDHQNLPIPKATSASHSLCGSTHERRTRIQLGNYCSRWENQRDPRTEHWPAARAPAALAIRATARSLFLFFYRSSIQHQLSLRPNVLVILLLSKL
jgi:hypothetical protein